MRSLLNIPPNGALDFLALGALVHRLDPGNVPLRKATQCAIHVSGGEFNVAANLADCFRLNTGIATAMVDYPIGDLIAERVRAMGVRPFYKRFAHNGVTGPNIATVYSDLGHGVRAPVVFYNRSNEAAALLKPGDFDWAAIFGAGVRWFHSGGIFAALSESTAALLIEAMRAAKAAGAVVSFDINYRPKLWSVRGGPDAAREAYRAVLPLIDVLVAGRGDIEHVLGDDDRETVADPPMDPDAYFEACARMAQQFPNLRALTTPLRDVLSANRHRWSAAAWIGGQTCSAPLCELDVLDRVGSGDGYAAGFFYGLLTGADPAAAVKLGWAHGALLTTYPGDTTMATLEQVLELAAGRSAKIQR
jgi:2-dehydro-3-deoxygluconokinase